MFRSILGRLVLAAALAIAVGAVVAGCGGSSTANQQEIAQAERHGRIERAGKEKERQLEQKLERLERENRQEKKRQREKERRELKEEKEGVSPPPPTESTPGPSTPEGMDCGSGTIAGPETSCGFALNTRAEYESYVGSGSGYVEAWSEANSKFYDMYCTEGSRHECSGAISATVYWP